MPGSGPARSGRMAAAPLSEQAAVVGVELALLLAPAALVAFALNGQTGGWALAVDCLLTTGTAAAGLARAALRGRDGLPLLRWDRVLEAVYQSGSHGQRVAISALVMLPSLALSLWFVASLVSRAWYIALVVLPVGLLVFFAVPRFTVLVAGAAVGAWLRLDWLVAASALTAYLYLVEVGKVGVALSCEGVRRELAASGDGSSILLSAEDRRGRLHWLGRR